MGIGSLNESKLHYQIKELYKKRNDKLESKVDGYFIDINRDELLIEIQTKNFGSIKKKISKLLNNHKLLIIYPIPYIKWISKIDKNTNEIITKRKSPKKGNFLDVFDEMIRFPSFINHKNFSLEIILTEINEIRCDDGKGSWRRKGVSIIDRELIKIHDKMLLKNKKIS